VLTRALIAAVLLVVAAAAADAVRNRGGAEAGAERPAEAAPPSWRIDRGPTPCRSLVPGACGRYLVLGGEVTRDGRPHLRRGELAAAFPGAPAEPVHAFRVADARDGRLAVAVRDRRGRGAVEVWRGNELIGAFRVPSNAFAQGLGWTRDGTRVATYPRRGAPGFHAVDFGL
jgi:hypothetical protein